MGFLVVFVAVLASAAALSTELPEPSKFALVFDEDQFEDYLDKYLAQEEPKWVNASSGDISPRNSGCTFRINGDLGQPQPVYIRNGDYLRPNGNSGQIRLNGGQEVTVACPGRNLRHPNIAKTVSVGKAKCVSGSSVSGSGWLNGNRAFSGLTCSNHAFHEAQATNNRCWGNNIVIRVGYVVNNVFHTLYHSCYNQQRMEVIYVWYEQTRENAVHQSGVDRPSFMAGSFYPGVSVNNMYTQAEQKKTIAQYVGQSQANKYVTNQQFLSRGHLAAKSDYVYATGQRATFYFINAAPQWQPFNAGNWNDLEQNLRARIAAANYKTTIYTGTFKVSQLRDQNNRLVDIYLVRQNSRIPVPLYFYKVVYDSSRRQGTAFVSINNPYYSTSEVRSLTFCKDRCRNNSAFNWLRWRPDRIDLGYSFCCTIEDFRKAVPHLPSFNTNNGLLT